MLTKLKTLPDPTKSVWEQPMKEIEMLMYVDKIVNKRRQENEQ
jgi:hypothetical protein